jgi:hypothetical protein
MINQKRNNMELKIKLKVFQDKFLFSRKRFPAMISGIGTGKTLMLLLKVWNYCEEYPNSLALVVRKEFTDLRDSTMKDFTRYFGVVADSNKEYHFPNGSVIMFRHASEVNVLKNVNLSIAVIEQAEEFETEETFTFIRDRLRRENGPYRQLCLIANAHGHNWIWRLWVNNPQSSEYDVQTACTFDNEDNLPEDFIADVRQMEIDAPNHYKQYVLNSFEEVDADDLLFTFQNLTRSIKLEFSPSGVSKRILSVDIARYGDDESVFDVLESKGVMNWEQIHQEFWKKKSLMETTGKVLDLMKTFKVSDPVIDDDGLGGGVTDRLTEQGINVIAYHGGAKADKDIYANKRTEDYFNTDRMIKNGYLKIYNDNILIDQLLTIKYRFNSRGQKMLIPKEEMRKDGIKSPDRGDALIMGVSHCDKATIGVGRSLNARSLPRESEDYSPLGSNVL